MENRKVVIIGDGAVGSTTAYTLMMQHYVNEIAIIDLNTESANAVKLELDVEFESVKKLRKLNTYLSSSNFIHLYNFIFRSLFYDILMEKDRNPS